MAFKNEPDRNNGKCWQQGCTKLSIDGSWFCKTHCLTYHANKADEAYQMRPGDYQCPWMGTIGRCTLRIGHFPEVPHKEDIGKNV